MVIGHMQRSEAAKEALDRFDHGTLEIECLADSRSKTNCLPDAKTGRAAIAQRRIAAAHQVVCRVRIPDQIGGRMRAPPLVFGDENLPAVSGDARVIETSNVLMTIRQLAPLPGERQAVDFEKLDKDGSVRRRRPKRPVALRMSVRAFA
jgi:hypothetical protein